MYADTGRMKKTKQSILYQVDDDLVLWHTFTNID